jgi:hypothetical protein
VQQICPAGVVRIVVAHFENILSIWVRGKWMLITSAFLVQILPHVFVPVNRSRILSMRLLINVHAGPVSCSDSAGVSSFDKSAHDASSSRSCSCQCSRSSRRRSSTEKNACDSRWNQTMTGGGVVHNRIPPVGAGALRSDVTVGMKTG